MVVWEWFGPVRDGTEDSYVQGEWKKRGVAVILVCGGVRQLTIDQGRAAREQQPPVQYLGNTYYEQWLHGLETLLVEKGLVTAEELRSGKAAAAKPAGLAPVRADEVVRALQQGSPYNREIDRAPAFAIGERVRVRNDNSPIGRASGRERGCQCGE